MNIIKNLSLHFLIVSSFLILLILSNLLLSNKAHAATFVYCGEPLKDYAGLNATGYPVSLGGATGCTNPPGNSRWFISIVSSGDVYIYLSTYFSTSQPRYIDISFVDESSDFDEDGCIIEHDICPGDPFWIDIEGYDIDGFDAIGEDRGGNTIGEGGGYGGSAGTGGSSPQLIPASDPQNGFNYEDGVLACSIAYPGYFIEPNPPLINYLPPGLVCDNECQYSYTATSYDFDTGFAYNNYSPTYLPCSGEETFQDLNLGQINLDPPPVVDPLECFLNTDQNIFECFEPGNYSGNPDTCFSNSGGTYGQEISCPNDVSSQIIDDNLCGQVNGIYACFSPSSGCSFASGSLVCFVPGTNQQISSTSPDHPQNGGNADGNENNDVFIDTDDVTANGFTFSELQQNTLEYSQLANLIDQKQADDFQAVVNQQASTNQKLDQLIQGGVGINNFGEFVEPVDDSDAEDLATDSIESVGSDTSLSFNSADLDNYSNVLSGLIPAGTVCQQFNYDLMPSKGMALTLDTCNLALIRTISEWLVYGLTLLALFTIIVGKREIQ